MKKLIIVLVCLSAAFANAAEPKEPVHPGDEGVVQRVRQWTVDAKVTNDKIVYDVGEKVEFVFEVKDEKGEYVKTDYVRLTVKEDGKGETNHVISLSKENPIRRTCTLERPGQIQMDALVYNPYNVIADKTIRQHHQFYFKDEKGGLRQISAGSGVLFGLRDLRAGAPEPEDFDAFWAEQKAADKALPFEVIEKRYIKTTSQGVKIYSLVLNALVGKIHAEMSIPEKAEKDPENNKLPIWVLSQAYGVAGVSTWPWPWCITITVNTHDIENYKDREYYKSYREGSLRDYAFAQKDNSNDNPKTAYFYGMFMRDYRAIRYLTETMPAWNGEIRFYGRSQGGMRSVVLAGLFPEYTVDVDAGVPWSNDLGGVLVGRPKLWRPNYTPALRYFDPVYHAKRIKKANVKISAGLIDTACQAAGIAALFNNLPESNPSRKLTLFQNIGHGIPEVAKGHFRYEYLIKDGKEGGAVIEAEKK